MAGEEKFCSRSSDSSEEKLLLRAATSSLVRLFLASPLIGPHYQDHELVTFQQKVN